MGAFEYFYTAAVAQAAADLYGCRYHLAIKKEAVSTDSMRARG